MRGINCSRAESYIMKQFDSDPPKVGMSPRSLNSFRADTIHKNAQQLAKHVLACEKCRALYLAMDEAAEVAQADLTDAPPNFTEAVMRTVRGLPKKEAGVYFPMRLVWGVSMLVFAAALFFVEQVSHAANILIAAVGEVLGDVSSISGTMNGLGVTALLLVAFMSVLLYVLHNDEHVKI
ncbi:MAG: hypothetical protein FWG87_00975 [Defluviitaleaceae bacterium]|nr:hypothetical protein [Defluviitaleaceae bacterium]